MPADMNNHQDTPLSTPFDYAAAVAAADPEVVDIIAAVFLEGFPRDIVILRQALASDDLEALRRTAHSIKGNCALFGAMPMVELARTLEQYDPSRDAGLDVGGMIGALETGFAQLRNALAPGQNETAWGAAISADA